MQIIEQIEKDALKSLIKNKYFYILSALFCMPLAYISAGYSLVILALLAITFAAVFCIDVKEYIIPDSAQLVIFILANLLIWQSDYRTFAEAYAGFFFAGIVFLSIYLFGIKVLKKDVIGLGDIKLMFNIGLLLGFLSFSYFLWILTLTSGLFVVVRKLFFKKHGIMPYGPFIVISAWFTLLYKDQLDILNYTIMYYIYN